MKFVIAIWLLVTGCTILHAQTTYLFVGTYTNSEPGKGIYMYRLNTTTGKLTLTGTGENITNPSFLTVSPDGKHLYACTDTKTALPGSISAFAVDSISGSIHFINKQSSAGANPVYLAVDGTNTFIVTGNYTEGNVSVLTANEDGSVNAALQTISFSDSGINKTRQEKAHIHSTIFSPGYGYLYLPDLGADKIRVFLFNPAGAAPLTGMDSLTVKTVPGAGPRHMVFHPAKPFAYCVEEMGGAVAVYRYSNGQLRLLQTINCNKKKAMEYSSADIHISPDGLFLYTCNRVENTLALFSIAPNGKLKLLGYQSTLGEVPRNFCIDPTGNFLLVANQSSHNVVVFRRNKKTGFLSNTGYQVKVPSPSCLQIRSYLPLVKSGVQK